MCGQFDRFTNDIQICVRCRSRDLSLLRGGQRQTVIFNFVISLAHTYVYILLLWQLLSLWRLSDTTMADYRQTRQKFWGKNLVGGFRTPRWPITAKQDKNFWGKKFSWRFSDTTMAYYRQSRQKYFVKFFYKIFFFFIIFFFVIFFFMKFFSRYFFCKKFLSIVIFFTFYFLFCWRFSDTITLCNCLLHEIEIARRNSIGRRAAPFITCLLLHSFQWQFYCPWSRELDHDIFLYSLFLCSWN